MALVESGQFFLLLRTVTKLISIDKLQKLMQNLSIHYYGSFTGN